MPRTAQHKAQLENKTKRGKLKPRSKPYFASIDNCLTIGYTCRRPAAGVWVARRQTGRALSSSGIPYGVYEQWQIGLADDLSPADGRTVFNFEQARAKQRAKRKARTRHATPWRAHGAWGDRTISALLG